MKVVKPIITISISLLTLFSPSSAFSQSGYESFNSWYLLLNHYQINDKWKVGNEVHYRNDGWKDSQQLIIRPFAGYSPSERSTLSGGYSYLETYPYGPYQFEGIIKEHNIWEQVELKHESKKWKFIHRYRLEQRWITTYDSTLNEHNLSNPIKGQRFRYRLTLKRDIGERYFLHLFDELWVRGSMVGDDITYDRNWIFLGLGRIIGNGNVQLAYLHQNIRRGDNSVEIHPSLQVVIQYDF